MTPVKGECSQCGHPVYLVIDHYVTNFTVSKCERDPDWWPNVGYSYQKRLVRTVDRVREVVELEPSNKTVKAYYSSYKDLYGGGPPHECFSIEAFRKAVKKELKL